MKYNHELVVKGASTKQTEILVKDNKDLIKTLLGITPYEYSSLLNQIAENYEKLIEKYCKYAFLLGYTRAEYEQNNK